MGVVKAALAAVAVLCTAGFATGQTINKALLLNESRVEVPQTVDIAMPALTLEAWMFVRDSTFYREDAAVIMTSGFDRAHAVTLDFQARTQHLRYSVRNHPTVSQEYAEVLSARPVTPRRWVHVAIVHASGVATMYVDGVLSGSAPVPQPVAAARELFLLGMPTDFRDSGSRTAHFDGLLDDVRLWNVARPVEDIRANQVVALEVTPDVEAALELYITVDDDTGELDRLTNDLLSPSDVLDASGKARTSLLLCADTDACRIEATDGKTACGDGAVNADGEECDDGNLVSGDGCSAACGLEAGWTCTAGQFGATQTCARGETTHAAGFEDAAAVAGWNPVVGKAFRVGDAALVSQAGGWESTVGARFGGTRGLRVRHGPLVATTDADLPASPLVWLRADAGVVTSGTSVTTWMDQSGNGHHATVPAGGTPPSLATDTLNGLPSVRFPSGTSGLVVADASSAVTVPYTIFAVTRFFGSSTPDGVLIHSMDATFRFGVCWGGVGWLAPGASYVKFPDDTDRDTAAFNWWYLSSGVADASGVTLYRDSAKVAAEASVPTDVGRLAFHTGGVDSASQSNAEVAEVLVYNRALSDTERQVVEQYLADKYAMSGPQSALVEAAFSQSPEQFVTYGSAALTGAVSAATLLSFAVRVEEAPPSFGVPLWVIVLEESTAPVPVPTDCLDPQQCGGRRYYSVCFNGGNDAVHCDDTVDVPLGAWRQQSWELHARFAAKYGTAGLPTSVRVLLAAIGGTSAAEAWVDELRLTTPSAVAECGTIRATSAGGASLLDALLSNYPTLVLALDEAPGAATAADATAGRFYSAGPVAASYSAGVTREIAPLVHDGGTAVALTSTADHIAVSAMGKAHNENGYTVSFWLRLTSTVTGAGHASILSDAAASSPAQVAVVIRGDGVLQASFATDRGVTSYAMTAALEVGAVYHVAVRYHPTGTMSFYVNGDAADSTNGDATTYAPPNRGYPVSPHGAWRVGNDGVHTATVAFEMDALAWYPYVLDNADLYRHYAAGRAPPQEAAGTIAAGAASVGFGAGEEGVLLAVVDAADPTAFLESHVYDVTNADLSVANAALAAMATFLTTAGVVNSNNYVVGVSKALAPRRYVLYEDNMHPTAYIGMDMHPSTGYHTMLGSDYAGIYPKTWSGAVQYCEDRNRYLCDLPDYCYLSTWPTTAFIPTVRGEVEGFGWTPYMPRAEEGEGNVGNNWLSVGKAYDDRVCRNYTTVFGAKPSWGDTSGSTDNPHFMCCDRVDYTPNWETVVERHWDFTDNATIDVGDLQYDDPRWRARLGWLESNSWYMLSMYRSFSSNRCSPDLKGSYALLDLPEAYLWTDYTLEVRVYTHYRALGLLFRYTDKHNHYRWMFNTQYRCSAWHKFATGETPGVQTEHSSGAPLYRYTWYDLRLVVKGDRYEIYVDGVLRGTYTDATHTRGTVALWASYNRHTYWERLRVYTDTAPAVATVNAALEDVGAAPLPVFEYARVPGSHTGGGFTWATIGRRSVPDPYPSWDTSILADYPRAVWQYGLMPSSSSPAAADGASTVSTLFNCPGQVLRVPENSLNGTYLAGVIRTGHGSPATGFRIHTGDDERVFGVEATTGQLLVADDQLRDASTSLDAEATAAFSLTVSAARRGFDSGVFQMRSQAEFGCYREVVLPDAFQGVDPTAYDTRVVFTAPDGANAGFRFHSMGATVFDDTAAAWAHYGGLISGVRNGTVHLWAPSYGRYAMGSIINLGWASGGVFDANKQFLEEVNGQKSHTANVRVAADLLRAADYDSGWVNFRSQSQYHAHEFFFHDLGDTPAVCKQYVRAVDGPLAGAVFEGRGDGQRSDVTGAYGGTVFGWNQYEVRVMAPDAWSRSTGHVLYVGTGWGNDQFVLSSDNAEVRAKCWLETAAPDFESDWAETQFVRYETAYREVAMNLPELPAVVQVLVKDPSFNMIFPAVHMEQSHNQQYYTGGGVVFAYDKDTVRLWAPSVDQYRSSNNLNTPLRTSHGWGGERYTWGRSLGQVKVRAWMSHPLAVRDTTTVAVEVANVEEPPRMDDAEAAVEEVVDGLLPAVAVTTLVATDGDVGASLAFDIVAGNGGGAFRVSGNQLFIANQTLINFEFLSVYNLAVRVTDGVFSSVGIVTVDVVNANDPIRIFPVEFSTPENQVANSIVGPPVQYADEDFDQQPEFSIVAGNGSPPRFKVNLCSGQLRVDTALLDAGTPWSFSLNFEQQATYALTMRVQDTGAVPTFATTTVTVNLVDVNDAPQVAAEEAFVLAENSLAGTVVAFLGANDEDGDALTFVVDSGDKSGYFTPSTDGVHGPEAGLFEGHPRYALRLSGDVVATGDGSGEGVPGLVLNYEDANRPSRDFSILMYVFDGREADDAVPASTLVTVAIQDVNDRPVLEEATYTVVENTPPGSLVAALESSDEDWLTLADGVPRNDPHTFMIVPGTDVADLPFTVTAGGDLLVGTAHALDFEGPANTYAVPVRVTDTGGNPGVPGGVLFRDTVFTVRVTDVNEPPTVAPEVTFDVEENTPAATLVGVISAVDQDIDNTTVVGDPLTYTIVEDHAGGTFIMVGSFVFVDSDQLDFEAAPALNFTLAVADPEGAVSLVLVLVNVLDVNDAPQFTSCAPVDERDAEFTELPGRTMMTGLLPVPDDLVDLVFNLGATVNVGADWQLCRDLCAVDARCAAYTTYTDPGHARYGQCWGRTDFFSFVTTLSPPDATVRSGEKVPVCQQVVMPETDGAGTPVGATYAVADVEGNPFTVELDADGNVGGAFSVAYTPATGSAVVSVAAPTLDFETQPRFLLRVVATDSGGAVSFVDMAVRVTDVNEYPVYPPQTRVVVENDVAGTLVGDPVLATDDDQARGQVLTYTMDAGTNNALAFMAITNDTAQVYLVAKMTVDEAVTEFVVDVTATDDEGLATTGTLTVDVERNNTRPVIENAGFARSVGEESPPGTPITPGIDFTDENLNDNHVVDITKVVPASGAALFAVDNAGGLTVAAAGLNYECARVQPLGGCPTAYHSYTLSVRVTDSGPGNLQAFAEVVVVVDAVEEAPQVPSALTLEVPENSPPGTVLVANPGPFPDWYDDDKTPLAFALSGPDAGLFVVAAGQRPARVAFDDPGEFNTLDNQFPPGQTPVVTVAPGAVLNFEAAASYALTLAVDDGATPQVTLPFTAVVVDVQEAPVMAAAAWSYTVEENTPGGTPVGSVAATDPDTADVITYVLREVQQITHRGTFSFEVPDSVSGQLVQRFVVDAATGAIALASPPVGSLTVIDYEEFVAYNLTVEARDRPEGDADALTATAVVAVTVLDVNDVTISSIITPTGRLATQGGEAVRIEGLNFGPFIGDADLQVAVQYRCNPFAAVDPATGVLPASACEYTAAGCLVTRPNTEITCTSVPGSGANHLWRVQVGDHATVSSSALSTESAAQTTSYRLPEIHAVTADTLSTRGGEAVTIDGDQMGPAGVGVSAVYADGRYAAPCVHESHTRAVCTSAEGVGAGHTWVITVDGQSSAASADVTSYAAPVVTQLRGFENAATGDVVDIQGLNTVGGDIVVVVGDNFGPVAAVGVVGATSGDVLAEASATGKCFHMVCRVVTPHTELQCVTAAGVGAGYTWGVSVAGQASNLAPQQTAYHAPELSRVYGDGAFGSPTEGGSRVFVAGRYFGAGPSAAASGAPGLVCATTGAVHEPSYGVNVTYGYLAEGSNTTLGRHFVAVGCDVVTADRLLSCAMAPGTGREHYWAAVVAGQEAPLLATDTFYAPPFVTQLSGPAAPSARTEGGQTLRVIGSNLGNDVAVITRVSYGPSGVEFNATGCVIVEPHRELECTTSEGVGAGLGFSVVVDRQESSVPRTTYLPPSNVTVVALDAGGYSTRGGDAIVLTGSDLGTASPRYLQGVSFGDDGEYALAGCEVVADHARLACTTPPGVGAGHRFVVTVEGQASTPSEQEFSYRAPVVLGVVWVSEPEVAGVDVPPVSYLPVSALPTVGARLRLVGTDLGTRLFGLGLVTGEEYATKAMVPKVYDEVSCGFDELGAPYPADAYCVEFDVPPGDGLERGIRVDVGGQSSATLRYSYGEPFIAERIVQQSETNRAYKILILRGTNFGLGGTVVVSPDNTTSAAGLIAAYTAQWVDGDPSQDGTIACDTAPSPDLPDATYGHEFIKCLLREVRGEPVNIGFIAVEVGVDRRPSNLLDFQQLSPRVLSYDPTLSPTQGGGTVTITGQYLGSRAELANLAVSIGNASCVVNAESYVEYMDPVCVDDDCTPSAPCPELAAGEDCSPRLEKRAAFQCRAPPGEGRDQELVVQLFEDKAEPKVFHYEAPTFAVTALSGEGVANGVGWSTRGTLSTGEWATLHGTNFGLFPRVSVNGTLLPYADVRVDDPAGHTQISFRVPPGQGRNALLHVHVANQTTASAAGGVPVLLHYAPPVITGFSPPTLAGPTTGGTVVTIVGDNFGLEFEGRIGVEDASGAFVEARVLFWNHTYAVVEMPAWQGRDLSMRVSVDGQGTTQLPDGVDVTYSYFPPSIASMWPKSAPTSGLVNGSEVWVAVVGDNLGVERVVYLGGEPAEVDDARSNHTHIFFRLSPGQGVRNLLVDAGQQVNALDRAVTRFEHELPSLVDLYPTTGRTDACQSLESVTAWYTRLRAPMAPGADRSRLCCRMETFQVRGDNFGVAPPVVTVGDGAARREVATPCNDSAIVGAEPGCVLREACILGWTHDTITFRGIPGEGVDLPVRIHVEQTFDGASRSPPTFANTSSVPFSYAKPVVTKSSPIPYDALGGETLVLEGYNFGEGGEGGVDVLLDDDPCEDVVWARDDTGRAFNGVPYLSCTTPNQVAGFKNLTVTVAGQVRLVRDFEERVQSVCKAGTWGLDGEFCLVCPDGGDCDGANGLAQDPVALPEFWREELLPTADGYEVVCPPERRGRPTCPLISACIPPNACTGNNTCAVGYDPASVRCSECIKGKYYRVGGECIKCPDNLEVLIVGLVVALLVMCGGAYYLNKKKLNMAILAVGIDYFQVLAIFANSKVAWPPGIKSLFRYLSFFSFNLDLTAPECLSPNLSWSFKWAVTQGIPIAMAAVFLLLLGAKVFWKRIVKGQTQRLTSSLPAFISSVVTLLYLTYLLLVRGIVDVLSCVPSVPEDPRGTLYMEATVQPCFEGAHLTVFPFAIAALCIYMVGFPVFAGVMTWRKRDEIKGDQLLRAMGVGDDRATNPEYYELRKTWHKLYYLYRPSCFYWVVCILARKAALAMTSLMFRSNPAFQLAMSLLVVFYAYVLQLKQRPYLCAAENDRILEDHERKAKAGSHLHARINTVLREVRRKTRRAGGAAAMGKAAGPPAAGGGVPRFEYQGWLKVAVNTNSVEAVLLGCACLVNLAGLMFESNQFSSDTDTSGERDFVTVCVILIVFLSISYWVFVFVIDVTAALRPEYWAGVLQRRAKRRDARLQSDAAKSRRASAFQVANPMARALGGDGDEGKASPKSKRDVQLAANPMFAKAKDGGAQDLDDSALLPDNMPLLPPPDSVCKQYAAAFLKVEKDVKNLMAQSRARHQLADTYASTGSGRGLRAAAAAPGAGNASPVGRAAAARGGSRGRRGRIRGVRQSFSVVATRSASVAEKQEP